MATSYGALCTDFYINQKLSLKLDVPTSRETVLDMFGRVRKELPNMERFRRYDAEVALESAEQSSQYSWLALRKTTIRSGWVNPETLDQAYKLHKLILDVGPYFLSISPLDVEFIELVFGFDLQAERNRNEVVFDALLANSPLASMVCADDEAVLEAQPFIGFSLNGECDLQAFVEIKTRTSAREVSNGRYEDEPISVYLMVRQYGPLKTMEDFATTFKSLSTHIESLAQERVIPNIVMPIRDAILSRPS
ncbi:MAG: hypothetical protein L0Y44_05200 [Phycisphaerales bacterium]|nr:hypothetical protein [Phycisphaerales bacterium]MCI0677080.1 hypothetical protein [Phycisphaerales bacterium]